MRTSSCGEGGVAGGGGGGGSGSRGVTALVKSSQGLRCGGIASPFKGGMVTSIHPYTPTPPFYTTLAAPLGPAVPGLSGVETAEGLIK